MRKDKKLKRKVEVSSPCVSPRKIVSPKQFFKKWKIKNELHKKIKGKR